MTAKGRALKRVVMGTGPDGVACFSEAGDPPANFLFSGLDSVDDVAHDLRPQRLDHALDDPEPKTVLVSEIFGSHTPVPSVAGDTASTIEEWNIESPTGGFMYRISTYGADVGMELHRTSTFDIDTVISGEMTIIAEDGTEVVLHSGDTVVIPGVSHAWRSGPEGCRVAFLMIGSG